MYIMVVSGAFVEKGLCVELLLLFVLFLFPVHPDPHHRAKKNKDLSIFCGCFKTVIPLALIEYEVIIATRGVSINCVYSANALVE